MKKIFRNRWMRYFNVIYILVAFSVCGRVYYLIKNSPIRIGPKDGNLGGLVFYSHRNLFFWIFVFVTIFILYNLIFYFFLKKRENRMFD